jgi:hypothetical protein
VTDVVARPCCLAAGRLSPPAGNTLRPNGTSSLWATQSSHIDQAARNERARRRFMNQTTGNAAMAQSGPIAVGGSGTKTPPS